MHSGSCGSSGFNDKGVGPRVTFDESLVMNSLNRKSTRQSAVASAWSLARRQINRRTSLCERPSLCLHRHSQFTFQQRSTLNPQHRETKDGNQYYTERKKDKKFQEHRYTPKYWENEQN
eukprot:4506585-Amphidinium_carterae.1